MNRKVMAAADAMAGLSAGSVTPQNARHRDAPRVRAASSVRGSRPSQSPPTTRTTTAKLKKAWARRIAAALPCRCSPIGLCAPTSARKAAPTTTVGSTNGTTTSAWTIRRPRNS